MEAPTVPVTPSPTLSCPQHQVPVKIEEVRPSQVLPGTELQVIGSGGYTWDECGGTIEGSRGFTLYLDGEPAGQISCYIHRCEAGLMLPRNAAPGPHCLSAQESGACQFELTVTSN